jgi:acyl-CoA reductase-like NAD-dependent aldehyde dehydrogenase
VEAGLPAGAVNVVHGGADVGDEIVTNRGVHTVGFTGSAQVGEIVAQRAGAKPLLLELGGNGPTIILDDADLERAIPATAQACYLNAGQICQSSERILVGRRVHDAVVDGLTQEAQRRQLGHPLADTTTMGPLNNEAVATKMDEHIADGLARGATVVAGGRRAEGFPTRLYYEPTVIDGITPDSLLNRDETFGPDIVFTSDGVAEVVNGLIIVAVVKLRQREGDDRLPVQVHGNTKLEIAWTITPGIVRRARRASMSISNSNGLKTGSCTVLHMA